MMSTTQTASQTISLLNTVRLLRQAGDARNHNYSQTIPKFYGELKVLFYGREVNGIDTHRRFCASLQERTKEGGSMMNYLLLFSFNSILGGTAQHHLHTSTTKIQNIETCKFLIGLQISMPYPNREIDLSTWEAIAVLPYLDREFTS
ncbi:hypothetical protein IGI04_015600 [Brassica rapa subsp. trilocularis]|uniref:Uncharacterized protein n=1 Tax=Brassica rapa subsp. trilocularis TaxID=1813537 RepID=A0ABQ7MS09_BRACM|nr:hypothetical protein IGI04_015600 [Brassica rapa subsp. trilocularis]